MLVGLGCLILILSSVVAGYNTSHSLYVYSNYDVSDDYLVYHQEGLNQCKWG